MLDKYTARQLEQIAKYLSHQESFVDHGVGYSTGCLGIFLFFYRYSLFTNNENYAKRAHILLNQAIEHAFIQTNASTRDVTEMGLMLLYLFDEGYLPNELRFINDKIDSLLYLHLESYLNQCNFDQFTGYLAAGSYFLKRGTAVSIARSGVQAVIDNLLISIQIAYSGKYWRSKFQNSNAIYLGWSHGMASIILFLVECIRSDIHYRITEIKAAIRDSIQYIMYNGYRSADCFYPDKIGEHSLNSTLNLCYGDIGIIYAIWQAAKILGEVTIMNKSIEQLLQLAHRENDKTCNVYDASIIYGSSGNVLFFDYMFSQTQRVEFKEAAEYWYQQGKRLSQHQGYVIGFKNYYNQSLSRTYPSFFEGISGYGLTILEHNTGSTGLLKIVGY